MLTYLIILLDETSVSYCHYSNSCTKRRLISLDDLKSGILWAMKQNLNIQFVYPDYELPNEYNDTIETIDHTKIKPDVQAKDADVLILTDWKNRLLSTVDGATCIIRATRTELNDYKERVLALAKMSGRLSIVLTDTESFTDDEISDYNAYLEKMADGIVDMYSSGKAAQLNILTDRIMLNEMNNCNAGCNNVTLAPNGRFYLCPAFYYDNSQNDIGNLHDGICIKNQHLLRLDHAPICRSCDAYQCRRCIWMNGKLTMDLNTPSHQQCVVAHLERNASRMLQQKIQENDIRINPSYEIEKINYLDPFNIVNKWKQEN